MSDAAAAKELSEPMTMAAEDAPQDAEPTQDEQAESALVAEPAESALVAHSSKRPTKSGEDRLAKRPRWGDKAFDDITIGDVETLVRKCAALEKKVEANAEAAEQLKELQNEKKALEKEMGEVGSDEVVMVKKNIAKQLSAQMLWAFPWNGELKEGRSISAFVPNVSPKLLKELGGLTSVNKEKQTICYFEKPLVKVVSSTRKAEQPLMSGLVLGGKLALKYIKTTRELQVETTYKFGNPDIQKAKTDKNKQGKRGRKGKKVAAEGDTQDGEEGEDAEDGEEEAAADDNVAAVDNEVPAIAIGGQ